VVRTGADLDGAQVVEIREDAVLLRRNGSVETLRLASLSVPGVTGASAAPASPANAEDNDPSGDYASTHGSKASRPAPVARRAARQAASRAPTAPASAAEPSEADVARSNDELLAKIASQARFAPVMDNDGKLRGVAVMNIVSDSMLEGLGLRSDDVVTAIQGVQVDSSGRAMSVARSLNWSQPVRLNIERGGVPTVVMVDPRSLQRR
jgi:general secretion pathway protein C